MWESCNLWSCYHELVAAGLTAKHSGAAAFVAVATRLAALEQRLLARQWTDEDGERLQLLASLQMIQPSVDLSKYRHHQHHLTYLHIYLLSEMVGADIMCRLRATRRPQVGSTAQPELIGKNLFQASANLKENTEAELSQYFGGHTSTLIAIVA